MSLFTQQTKDRIQKLIHDHDDTIKLTPLEKLNFWVGAVFLVVTVPMVLPPLGLCILWEGTDRLFRGRPLDGLTMSLARWVNEVTAPFLSGLVRNPKDAFAFNTALWLGVAVPSAFFYCMFDTIARGAVNPKLWIAYHVFRLGPYFMSFAYTYTMCHKEGHSHVGIFKGPIAPVFNNIFNWWAGLFYGVMPSSFAYGHSINHHRYNNGPKDVVSIADKPRDQWRAFVAFLPRWVLYTVNISTVIQFIEEKNYKVAWRVFLGSVYALCFFLVIGRIAGPQFVFFFLVAPIFEQSLLLSCVMWVWHGFLDVNDPADAYVGSTTVLEGPINVLGEDYHVVHHQYPGTHWENNAELYKKHFDKGEYRESEATVFRNTHVFEVYALILLRKYDELAMRFVDLSGKLTESEKVDLIKARLRMCWWGHRKPDYVKLTGKELGNYDLGMPGAAPEEEVKKDK